MMNPFQDILKYGPPVLAWTFSKEKAHYFVMFFVFESKVAFLFESVKVSSVASNPVTMASVRLCGRQVDMIDFIKDLRCFAFLFHILLYHSQNVWLHFHACVLIVQMAVTARGIISNRRESLIIICSYLLERYLDMKNNIYFMPSKGLKHF